MTDDDLSNFRALFPEIPFPPPRPNWKPAPMASEERKRWNEHIDRMMHRVRLVQGNQVIDDERR